LSAVFSKDKLIVQIARSNELVDGATERACHMTGLHDVSYGKVEELIRQLSIGGLDEDLLKKLLRGKPPASQLVEELRRLASSEAERTSALFRSSNELYAAFAMRADRLGWPFTREQINELHRTQPRDHVSQIDKALSLDVWLGSAQTTIDALIAWNVDVHPGVAEMMYWDMNASRVRLTEPERYGSTPSVRWVELNLRANLSPTGVRSVDVRRRSNPAGIPVLTAAALHTPWVRALDTKQVPGVGIPGIILPWSNDRSPELRWGSVYSQLEISCMSADLEHYHYAHPTYRDL
jgi:hypothetical protein